MSLQQNLFARMYIRYDNIPKTKIMKGIKKNPMKIGDVIVSVMLHSNIMNLWLD